MGVCMKTALFFSWRLYSSANDVKYSYPQRKRGWSYEMMMLASCGGSADDPLR